MAHKILENNYFKKISVRYLKKVILKKNLINLKKIHTDHWSVFIQISNLYDPYGSVILMGFPLQQKHKFSEKLHRKFKTNSNNHPKNSYKQKYNHATTSQYQKIVIAWTKSLNSFKGNVPLIWKTITQRPEQNQNHHQWKKWTAKEHENNNNHDQMTGIRTRMDDRNTRIDRRRTSGWEEDEEQTTLLWSWDI